jgi:diguanylate cyclase (GGDEF)-like protein
MSEQALLDLESRTRQGMYLHLVLWLLVALASGVARQTPIFFVLNTLGFMFGTAMRNYTRRNFADWVANQPAKARSHLFNNVVLFGIHWGLLAAAADVWPPLHSAQLPLMFVVVGLVTAGTVVLAIERVVCRWYPFAVMGPSLLTLLLSRTPDHLLLALMALIMVAYVFRVTRLVHDDYWSSARARAELEERAVSLEHLSFTDALTQIPNRLHFQRALEQSWAEGMRTGQPLSLLMIDMDHFKVINDTFGHAAGDACLKAAAQSLRAVLGRSNDLVARYGGEEFVALLIDADPDQAQLIAQRLRREVAAARIVHDGHSLRIACSIGLATMAPNRETGPADLIERADRALYAAKQQGRDRVVAAA